MTATCVNTTCPYCGVGCGLTVTTDNLTTHVVGDDHHPANRGRACIKGSTLAETLKPRQRLLKPRVNGEEASWAQALDHVASGFANSIERHGRDSVALYVSGQLLTEDYYIANKLMKGFIGSGNIDTNSRLCMSSAVAAHKRAFGEDLVPGCYEDLEQADLLILVGSNMAYTHPVLLQRIQAARRQRPQQFLVVIDPRRTATCEVADLHLPIAPGSDAILFNGLLHYLHQHNALSNDFIMQHTQGFDEALAAARDSAASLEFVARQCDLAVEDVARLYQRFAATERVVTAFCQGINQSSTGTDKGNAIINCHLASGKIGKPGATPFSVTGQPNAMGGREVGGLANTLAAHMDFSEDAVERVARFWQAPNIATGPGLKAVELFEAVHAGRIKALWIMGTNPVVSMPDADFIREALRRCELVVVSDCVSDTDTAQMADVLLPALSWGEKTGTVTNSERCISLQRAFLQAPGAARPDWEIIRDVAHRLGYAAAFNYSHPADIFREHAALSGFENNGQRAFNIADRQTLSNADYMAMQPFQWPANQSRLFTEGRFYTDNQKARFIAVTPAAVIAANAGTLTLNTGRLRDQWHTMTRTGVAPTLFSHCAEPEVHLHPGDAAELKLPEGALAKVGNAQGKVIARVRISSQQRRGDCFLPIHWGSNYASCARVSALVERRVDPISGQPHFKQTAVSIKPYPAILEGILLLHSSVSEHWTPGSDYWAKAPIANGIKVYLAETELQRSATLAADIQAQFKNITVWLKLDDQQQHGLNLAGFIGDRLVFLLLTARDIHSLPDSRELASWLGKPVDMHQRFRLLEGKLSEGLSSGPIICSCYQVSQSRIEQAIQSGSGSVEALGQQLRCGTNCGSCIPELQQLLRLNTSP